MCLTLFPAFYPWTAEGAELLSYLQNKVSPAPGIQMCLTLFRVFYMWTAEDAELPTAQGQSGTRCSDVSDSISCILYVDS